MWAQGGKRSGESRRVELSKSIPNLANSTGKSVGLNTRAEGVKGESRHRVSRHKTLEIRTNMRQNALRTRVGDRGARAGPNVKAGSRATSPRGDARHVREYRRSGEGTWAGMLDGTGGTERDGNGLERMEKRLEHVRRGVEAQP